MVSSFCGSPQMYPNAGMTQINFGCVMIISIMMMMTIVVVVVIVVVVALVTVVLVVKVISDTNTNGYVKHRK